jgi:predicted SPOUT superfamily RNA methylase MTH1
MSDLWVAIPDTALSDEQTRRDKSVKIAQFARACSIFRVRRIYVYHDSLSQFERDDPDLLKIVLRYLDTPQYLRKTLYPKMNQLEYAGVLHPIKAPHHRPPENIRNVKVGDVRTGVIRRVKGQLFVEVGLGSPALYVGQGVEGEKASVRFVSPYPNLKAIDVKEEDIPEYWGYKVKEVPSLADLLASKEKDEVIVTSRKGNHFKNVKEKLAERAKIAQNILVVFGAPRHGVSDILAKEGGSINANEFFVNMFPCQGTETVRLEEAVLGTLAILNSFLPLNERFPRCK